MELREQFEKETGESSFAYLQKYSGALIEKDGFSDEYVEWLESKVKKLNIDDVSKRYSEKDMLNAAKYGYEYRDTTSFPEMDFDSNCKNNTRQWLTTVK